MGPMDVGRWRYLEVGLLEGINDNLCLLLDCWFILLLKSGLFHEILINYKRSYPH